MWAGNWPGVDELLGDAPDALLALPTAERYAIFVERFIEALRARPLTIEILAAEIVTRNELTAILETEREAWGGQVEALIGGAEYLRQPHLRGITLLLVAGVQFLLVRSRTVGIFGGFDLQGDEAGGSSRKRCAPWPGNCRAAHRAQHRRAPWTLQVAALPTSWCDPSVSAPPGRGEQGEHAAACRLRCPVRCETHASTGPMARAGTASGRGLWCNPDMLRSLKELFSVLTPPSPVADAQAVEHTLQLATAVMLMEVMRADRDCSDAERRAVIDALRATFDLSDDEIERLVEVAADAAREATDWFEFTSHINAHFDMPAKIRMVEYMWRVAYADGHLGDHERHVMWRLSDLLHVPHGAYINAKMRTKQASGG